MSKFYDESDENDDFDDFDEEGLPEGEAAEGEGEEEEEAEDEQAEPEDDEEDCQDDEEDDEEQDDEELEDEDEDEDEGDQEDDEADEEDEAEAQLPEATEIEEMQENSKVKALKEKVKKMVSKIKGDDAKELEPDEEDIGKRMYLPIISHETSTSEIYRNTYLFYASSQKLYDQMRTYIDYHDGSLDIRDFEKTCSLQKLSGSELVRICEDKEKERRKLLISQKKAQDSKIKLPKSLEPTYISRQIDLKKDVREDSAYDNFKQNLECCNSLNGLEFYQGLYKDFCGKLGGNEHHDVDEGNNIEFPSFSVVNDDAMEHEHHLFGRMSNEGSQQATPRNNLEAMLYNNYTKSPFGHSPGNSSSVKDGPFDSFHSISFNDTWKGNASTVKSSNLATPGFTNYAGQAEINSVAQKTSNIESLDEEKSINSTFRDFLNTRWKEGKLGIAARSRLDKRAANSDSSIFKFESIKTIEEEKDKHLKEEVYLQYTKARANNNKRLKIENEEKSLSYFNRDLVYSTWYEDTVDVLNTPNDNQKHPKGDLLIDLNDSTAVYTKLRDRLKEEIIGINGLPVEWQNGELPDNVDLTDPNIIKLLQKYKGGPKAHAKYFNKEKKKLRIMLVQLTKDPEAIKQIAKGWGTEGENSLLNFLKKQKIDSFIPQFKPMKRKRRKITNYNHSNIATSFQYNLLSMTPDRVYMLHRYDISRTIEQSLSLGSNSTWRVKVVNRSQKNYPLKYLMSKRRDFVDSNSKEIHHSYKIFKKLKKISLNSDDFVLFEYIEKDPLIIGNVGMASRLSRYYYPDRVAQYIKKKKGEDLDNEAIIKEYNTTLDDVLGELGEDVGMSREEKLPILGQLTKKDNLGLTILENNMYKLPVFKQKPKKTDFVLVRCLENGQNKYYLRRITHLYTTGQVQPKLEVFCPYSRQFRSFVKKLLKSYIKRSFEEKGCINLEEVKEILPTMNDHNIRKHIKMLGGEQDQLRPKLYLFNSQLLKENKANDYADEMEASVTPEELCLYERMYQSYYHLCDFGIIKLKSSDKISVIKTKFYRKNISNPRKCAIARRIIEELYLSAWNLSNCFFDAVQRQGRMYLKGYGDPTNGHGGINYIKLPLKISRYESQLFRKARKGKPQQMVTGTDADLRRLGMDFVHSKLKEHGYTEESLARLERWDKIDLLRDIANKQIQEKGRVDPELQKFSRNMRMTTKMQKDKYQGDINRLLAILIENLSNPKNHKIPSDDEMDLIEDFDHLLLREEKELEKYQNLANDDDEEDPSNLSDGGLDGDFDGSILGGDIRNDIAFD